MAAGYTKAELRILVKQAVGGRSSATITNGWYDQRIHNGYVRLCTFQGPVSRPGRAQPQFRVLRFFELEERTARSLTTSLTTNFVTAQAPASGNIPMVVSSLYDRTNNISLRRPSRRDVLRLDPDATGRPTRWLPAGQGGVVGYFLDKIPVVASDNIDVYEYTYCYPVEMATDGTYPLIPPAWHEAIWLAAAVETAALLDMPEKADELNQRFLAFIAERKTPHEEASSSGIGGARGNIRIGPIY